MKYSDNFILSLIAEYKFDSSSASPILRFQNSFFKGGNDLIINKIYLHYQQIEFEVYQILKECECILLGIH